MSQIQFNKPSGAVLLDVINLRNPGANLTVAEITLKTAVPYPGTGYNTVVDIVGKNNRYRERQRVRYTRFQLTELFAAPEILVPDEFYTVEEALAQVNQNYAVLLQPHEVFFGSVDADGGIDIRIRDSYLFSNGSEIRIRATSTTLTRFEEFADRIHHLANVILPAAVSPLLAIDH